jgi:ABC-2 type transport system ATP-binding protein
MIEARNISKSFNDIVAVDDVSFIVKDKTVFGLIGTNGSGKSTVLRLLTGVFRCDRGEVVVDGCTNSSRKTRLRFSDNSDSIVIEKIPLYDNIDAKKLMYFIPDDPYFFSNSTAVDIEKYLSTVYKGFKRTDFYTYLSHFQLEKNRKIHTFSKGMRKQLAMICGICANTKYLICDETFDGLDSVMRQGVKAIFADEMAKRELTPIVASHNLREIEDICDFVGLLHRGKVLLSRDLEEMKSNLQKIQCVFTNPEDEVRIIDSLSGMRSEKRGSLCILTVRGTREEVMAVFATAATIFFETIPLSLEEIFISETEVAGYDLKKLILG